MSIGKTSQVVTDLGQYIYDRVGLGTGQVVGRNSFTPTLSTEDSWSEYNYRKNGKLSNIILHPF